MTQLTHNVYEKNHNDLIKDFKFFADYAKYDPLEKRRETWDEAIDRVMSMHRTKYKDELSNNKKLQEIVSWAESKYRDKLVLGSQRALQFGGQPILDKNMKLYNCAVTYIDRPRSFQEIMWMLLCGCGVGFSVQKSHVSQLPKLKSRTKHTKVFEIPDSIEGWADAIGIVVSSFMDGGSPFPDYEGKTVHFDYSNIREKGSFISGGFKAPGPEGLKRSIEKIESLLKGLETITPIVAYDIVMHMSDAVLSGGVRRSATICLFDKDDEEMMSAKTGDWYVKNPQRARSNNSVILKRDELTKEEFDSIFDKIRQFGEPGFVFTDDLEYMYNPCQPNFAHVLTKEGIKKFGDVDKGDIIWSEDGWTEIIKKWSTGTKPVYKYKTTAGSFISTENHRIVSGGEKIEVGKASDIDLLQGPIEGGFINLQDVMDGLVIGDGTTHLQSTTKVYLDVGENDMDYFDDPISKFFIEKHAAKYDRGWKVKTTVTENELPKTFNRVIPDRFFYGNNRKVRSFLRGLYSANGSICGNRVTLKSSSFKLIEQVQEMLSSVGIRSYYTTNKPSKIEWDNGTYESKESYDLNISSDRDIFLNKIGFIQKYKVEKLQSIVDSIQKQNRTKSHEIIGVEYLGDYEVFDITVSGESHTYWSHGFNTSNCVEIGMRPIDDETGLSGWQTCNLTEGNGSKIKTEQDFYDMCRASAILGTLQAGYADCEYLGETSKKIIERESLLGCSVTGMMSNPDILFDEKIQRRGAEIVKRTNKEVARLIGINQAARTTCIKPSGNSSVMLGTTPATNGWHHKRFIRTVQVNKDEFAGKVFKETNPKAVEDSVWSANKTDWAISFPMVAPETAKFKSELSAVDQLEYVKLTQNNWVEHGTNEHLSTKQSLRHNVSNTINVGDEEWDEVGDYIYKNKEHFAGISLLSRSGDKDYNQAPYIAVYTPEEIISRYGNAGMFASGLIVDSLHAFGNLWSACDSFLGIGEDLSEETSDNALKRDWVRRAKQFSERYFDSDTAMTYCLKEVHIYHKWLELQRSIKYIDWESYEEEPSYTDIDTLGAIACAGGKCEI